MQVQIIVLRLEKIKYTSSEMRNVWLSGQKGLTI